jgi:hypothetical protein
VGLWSKGMFWRGVLDWLAWSLFIPGVIFWILGIKNGNRWEVENKLKKGWVPMTKEDKEKLELLDILKKEL